MNLFLALAITLVFATSIIKAPFRLVVAASTMSKSKKAGRPRLWGYRPGASYDVDEDGLDMTSEDDSGDSGDLTNDPEKPSLLARSKIGYHHLLMFLLIIATLLICMYNTYVSNQTARLDIKHLTRPQIQIQAYK